jgi:hypothetical protein
LIQEINIEMEISKLDARIKESKKSKKNVFTSIFKSKKNSNEFSGLSFTLGNENGIVVSSFSENTKAHKLRIDMKNSLLARRAPIEYFETPIAPKVDGSFDDFMNHLNESIVSLDSKSGEVDQEGLHNSPSIPEEVPTTVSTNYAADFVPTDEENTAPKLSTVTSLYTKIINKKTLPKTAVLAPAPQIMTKPAGHAATKIKTEISMVRTTSVPPLKSPRENTPVRSRSAEATSPANQINFQDSKKALKVLGFGDDKPNQNSKQSGGFIAPVSSTEFDPRSLLLDLKPSTEKAFGIAESKVRRKPVQSRVNVRQVSSQSSSNDNIAYTGTTKLNRAELNSSETQSRTVTTSLAPLTSAVSPSPRSQTISDEKALALLGIVPNRTDVQRSVSPYLNPKSDQYDAKPLQVQQTLSIPPFISRQGATIAVQHDGNRRNMTPSPSPMIREVSRGNARNISPLPMTTPPPPAFQSTMNVPPILRNNHSFINAMPRPHSVHVPRHPSPPPAMQRSFTNPIIYALDRDPGRFPTFTKPTCGTREAISSPEPPREPVVIPNQDENEIRARQRHLIYLKHVKKRSESTILYTHNSQPSLDIHQRQPLQHFTRAVPSYPIYDQYGVYTENTGHPQALRQSVAYKDQHHQGEHPQIPSRTMSLTEMKQLNSQK